LYKEATGLSHSEAMQIILNAYNKKDSQNFQTSQKLPFPTGAGYHRSSSGVRTAKLVCGIISIVVFMIIVFQSCAAGIVNVLESNIYDVSGTAGVLLAVLMLIGGIVGITTRNNKSGGITAGVFYFAGGIIGITSLGTFTDLIVWSIMALAFSLLFIVGSVEKASSKVIWTVFILLISALPLLYAISISENGGANQNPPSGMRNDVLPSPTPAESARNNTQTSSPEVPRIDIPSGGIIMFDEAEIIVKLLGIKRNRSGYITEIEFEIENIGENENSIRITPNLWSVIQINNLTFKNYMSATVMPGRKSIERIRLDNNEVEMFGLRNIHNMTIQFQTDEPNDSFMMQNIVVFEPSTVLIANGGNNTDFLDAGSLVFSSDEVNVYSFGLRGGIFLSYADFVVHNKTNSDLRFRFGSLSIDGYMDTGFETSEDVFAGTFRVFSVSIDSTDINEIEFMLRAEEFLSIISLDGSRDIGLVNAVYD
jgi:hypothetical protein